MRHRYPRPAARIVCGLLVGVGLALLVLGCAATSSDTDGRSVGLTSATPSGAGATATSAADPTQYVSVVHPYHSEYLDAPNYLLPTEITLAPGISLPEFPLSVPAQKIASERLPATDLKLRPSPVRAGEYSWRLDSAEDPTGADVILGAQDVAVERAGAFLHEHGLWDTTYGEPEVRIGSRDSGPDGEFITSWLVRFPGEALAGGMEEYASLRVGHENRVVGLTLFIPRLEVLPDRFIRLRPLTEVVRDLRAWRNDGHPSSELQNGTQGEVIVEVMNVSLAYEDPGSGGEPLAVPVYRFEVEVRCGDGATSTAGTWSVVAAADVEDRVFR